MEGKRSNTALIVIIIVVILCLLCIAPFLVGVFFLWAQSFSSETVEHSMDFRVRCIADAAEDTITVEVLSGTVSWYDYEVKANDISLTTGSLETTVGDEAIFTGLEFEPGESIHITIIELENTRAVWSDTITSH